MKRTGQKQIFPGQASYSVSVLDSRLGNSRGSFGDADVVDAPSGAEIPRNRGEIRTSTSFSTKFGLSALVMSTTFRSRLRDFCEDRVFIAHHNRRTEHDQATLDISFVLHKLSNDLSSTISKQRCRPTHRLCISGPG